jgi:hypothetical protein
MAQQNVATAIAPFFASALSIVMDDVDITCTGKNGNAVSPDASGLTGSSFVTADWGQVTLAASSLYFDTVGAPNTMNIDNLSIHGSVQSSDACDLTLIVPHGVGGPNNMAAGQFSNIHVGDYIAGGAGAVPNYRVNIVPSGVGFGIGEGNNVVDQLTVLGKTGSGSGTWTNNGIIGIQPQNGLTLRKGKAGGFASPTPPTLDVGYYLNYGTGLEFYEITVEDCKAEFLGNGFVVPSFGPGAQPLDKFKIIGGFYDSNTTYGIYIAADNHGGVQIEVAHASNNGSQGINIVVSATGVYPPAPKQMLNILNNFCQNNDALAANRQISVISNHATLFVRFFASGNSCLFSDGNNAYFEVATNSGSTGLPSTGSFPIFGVETGITGTTTAFTSVTHMFLNHGALLTP